MEDDGVRPVDVGTEDIDPGRAYALADLRGTLDAVRRLDPSAPGSLVKMTDDNYRIRNALILQCLTYALQLGMTAGISVGQFESEGEWWGLVYMDLPTGQVSWHLPLYTGIFDGHTTAEKYERIERFRMTP